jgi:hypothetical protein
MVGVTSLWLPILLAAVIVFVASSIIHMALPWHKNDFKRFAAEDTALDKLRSLELAPGDYAAPMADSMADMSSEAYKAKIERGPQVMLTVLKPGGSMGVNLLKWFVYLLVVSLFAAYVGGATLGEGAGYRAVFHLTSTVAFAGYALAVWQNWIWYSRNLGYTIRTTIDGLVYALLTGGVFGWLWP